RVEKYFLKEDGFFNKDDFSSEKIWFQSIIEAGKEGALVKMQSFSGANEVHTFSMNVKLLNSTLKRYLVIFEDVTNLEQERTFYQEAATHDQLTGIYNRFFFKDELVRSLAAARRYGDGFGVIILDLDKFKLINDSYGHLAGDVVLKSVSKVIQNRLRNSDVFARWGGEEFIVLLPSTDIDEAAELAEDLRLSIESFEIEKVGTITCSFGVTHWREGDNEKSLISRADEALYEAKKSGRNKVCKKLD
ncbi:MAG: GGDEF domain-containing protein, partial [Thiovulaceae bacterium]|nr:GGDEF domain-containing protein [Sulfurimonadaceae bacterium]